MITMKDSLLDTEAKLKSFTDKMRSKDAFNRTIAGWVNMCSLTVYQLHLIVGVLIEVS